MCPLLVSIIVLPLTYGINHLLNIVWYCQWMYIGMGKIHSKAVTVHGEIAIPCACVLRPSEQCSSVPLSTNNGHYQLTPKGLSSPSWIRPYSRSLEAEVSAYLSLDAQFLASKIIWYLTYIYCFNYIYFGSQRWNNILRCNLSSSFKGHFSLLNYIDITFC